MLSRAGVVADTQTGAPNSAATTGLIAEPSAATGPSAGDAGDAVATELGLIAAMLSPDASQLALAIATPEGSALRIYDWSDLSNRQLGHAGPGSTLTAAWLDPARLLVLRREHRPAGVDLTGAYVVAADGESIDLGAKAQGAGLLQPGETDLELLQPLADGRFLARATRSTSHSVVIVNGVNGERSTPVSDRTGVTDVLFRDSLPAVLLQQVEDTQRLSIRAGDGWQDVFEATGESLRLEGWLDESRALIGRRNDAGRWVLDLLDLETARVDGPILSDEGADVGSVSFSGWREGPLSVPVLDHPPRVMFLSSSQRRIRQGVDLALPDRLNRIVGSVLRRHVVASRGPAGEQRFYLLDERRATLRSLPPRDQPSRGKP
ncbi:MAG: hypothetical protein AAGA95_03540 [Pseudomonadota bacterium]